MCDCIELTNKSLEEQGFNTELDIPMMISVKTGTEGKKRIRIATKKSDKSKRVGPIALMASYCPFCGEKYQNEQV